MRFDRRASRGRELRREIRIHARHDRVGITDAVPETRGDLRVPQASMLEVLRDQHERIDDDRAVAREDARRRQRRNAFQRAQVRAQPAAAACRNHDRRAVNDHVTAVEPARRGVPETDVVERVAWRVNHGEHGVAGANLLPVGERGPAGFIADDPFGGFDRWPARAKRGHAARVVAVAVRDEDPAKRSAAEGVRDRVNVRGNADAGVNQRRLFAVQQPRVVPAPGQRAWIESGDGSVFHRICTTRGQVSAGIVAASDYLRETRRAWTGLLPVVPQPAQDKVAPMKQTEQSFALAGECGRRQFERHVVP